MCIEFVKKNKYVGAVVIGVILFFTIFNTYSQISTATNNTDKNTAYLIAYFATHFPPNEKFKLYDYDYKTTLISLPLVLYLDHKNKIAENGIKIGIENTTQAKGQIIEEDSYIYHEYLVNLQGLTDKQIGENQWISVTPLSIYNSTENWYKK